VRFLLNLCLISLCTTQLNGQETGSSDWLIDPDPFTAQSSLSEDGRELVLENGLVRRTWRLSPNAACVAIDNLTTGESLLRAVRPEARLVLDGVAYDVGGLHGQPNHAFLLPEWLDAMQAKPADFQYTGYRVGKIQPRFAWKRVRHHAPDAAWPPPGVHLQMDYQMSDAAWLKSTPLDLELRQRLYLDDFQSLNAGWQVSASTTHERSSFNNEGKTGEIYTPANTYVFAQRDLNGDTRMVQCVLDPGTDRSASWGPGMALVFGDQVVKFNLRVAQASGQSAADQAESAPVADSVDFGLGYGGGEKIGGASAFKSDRSVLNFDHAWRLRMRWDEQNIICEAAPYTGDSGPPSWVQVFESPLPKNHSQPGAVRVGKMSRSGGAQDFSDAGTLTRCKVIRFEEYSAVDSDLLQQRRAQNQGTGQVSVTVHYELYDGIPLYSKWLEVHNGTDVELEVDRFTSEILAVVEYASWVEKRDGVAYPRPQSMHVETDYAFGGFVPENAMRSSVHWRSDPQFRSQVNWQRINPCQLEVEPMHGPDVLIAPGKSFTSFRAFELLMDSSDRERRSLAQRRMYRILAPWVTENPLILHVVSTDPKVVRGAIDQAAECGFEMISLSFGSGLSMENESAENLAKFRRLADYAASKNIDLGGYSLLASRRIQPDGDNAINIKTGKPGGHTFGNAPALASNWGQNYFRKLYKFFTETGFLQFTHDGSYPGDWDAAARPPLQRGYDDSQWVQFGIIRDYYRWLRARGVYLRVPDFYYLNGANECGMGYREVNWSLPRDMQVIHTRQNIYDGTWSKTPSMGWMFVPLTQYHGGGAAATIEPLDQHMGHYERMMTSNLALGVQAVYRGFRLYDTPRVRDQVVHRVNWYKQFRDILESDVIHGRRADGRDLDWMLHVNPKLDQRGMLVVFNPLATEVTRTLKVPLYYTGLTETAQVSHAYGAAQSFPLARDYSIQLQVTVPAKGMGWYIIR
jgi:hypothetical protein